MSIKKVPCILRVSKFYITLPYILKRMKARVRNLNITRDVNQIIYM